jgi:hypothetical protein
MISVISMIKVAFPEETEEALRGHTHVGRVLWWESNSVEWRETLKAFIVLKEKELR